MLLPVFLICHISQGQDSIINKDISKYKFLIFPVAARSIETSWSVGAATSVTFHASSIDTLSRTSNLQGIALYTFKNQFIAAINGSEYLKNEQYIINQQLSFSSFPDKCWGIGNNTPDSAEENYSFKQFYVYLHVLRKLKKHLYIGSLIELQNVLNINYLKGGVFDKQQISGRIPYFIAGVGLSLTYDNRNDAFAPTKGTFIQCYFNHFGETTFSDFNYTNIVADYRKFISISAHKVLAFQAYFFGNVGSEIPIRSLASFGGNNSMRGFYDGRYRDKNQFVLQSEYRLQLYKRWGLTFFGSTGDVSNKFNYCSINSLKYAYGGGLRFRLTKNERLNLRLDYGIGGGNNNGLYFQLGEAF